MPLELKILTADSQFLKAIEFNYEELKTALSDKLEKYNNLHYDETQLKEAKSDRALLNKFKAAIEAQRKDVKSKCMAPYLQFETKIKDLVSIVDKPILAIDTQVKKYDEERKKEKYKYFEDYYNGEAQELKELLPFDRVLNDRWLNATYNKDTAIQEIFNIVGKTKKDLETLKTSVDPKFQVEVTNVYLQTLDLGEALRRNSYLQEQQKKQAEYAAAQQVKVQTPQVLGQSVRKADARAENTPTQQIDFRVWVTPEQKVKLKRFLIEAGIKYGSVK